MDDEDVEDIIAKIEGDEDEEDDGDEFGGDRRIWMVKKK